MSTCTFGSIDMVSSKLVYLVIIITAMRMHLLSILVAAVFFLGKSFPANAQAPAEASQSLDSIIPVRGFCVGAPRPDGVDSFVHFINDVLAPKKVNTLFVLIDYHYQFKSHPELADTLALSNADVKKIVRACAQHKIRIIPQIDMLGHQGWEEHPNKLLLVYPQFDETPWVKNPEKYVWPNADNLYCRRY